jgi:hypothetical protein
MAVLSVLRRLFAEVSSIEQGLHLAADLSLSVVTDIVVFLRKEFRRLRLHAFVDRERDHDLVGGFVNLIFRGNGGLIISFLPKMGDQAFVARSNSCLCGEVTYFQGYRPGKLAFLESRLSRRKRSAITCEAP